MKFIGVDVSKEKLDVYIRPDKKHFIVENKPEALIKLANELEKLKPELVAMESTGGYERQLVRELVKSGVKTSVVNPKLIKDFGRSGGARAKTDKLDSGVIAHYAEVHHPHEVILASEEEEKLEALVTRRRQLSNMKVAELNRLKHAEGEIATDISDHISWIDKKLKEIEQKLQTKIQQSEELQQKGELITSMKGVGPVLTSVLLMDLPELGKVSKKKISALVGLAPFNVESGKFKGQMKIYGGRKEVRAALYMPTWSAIKHNPDIRDFYQKLIAKGKKKKVAVTACMHKLLITLNSIVRKGVKWTPQYSACTKVEGLN